MFYCGPRPLQTATINCSFSDLSRSPLFSDFTRCINLLAQKKSKIWTKNLLKLPAHYVTCSLLLGTQSWPRLAFWRRWRRRNAGTCHWMHDDAQCDQKKCDANMCRVRLTATESVDRQQKTQTAVIHCSSSLLLFWIYSQQSGCILQNGKWRVVTYVTVLIALSCYWNQTCGCKVAWGSFMRHALMLCDWFIGRFCDGLGGLDPKGFILKNVKQSIWNFSLYHTIRYKIRSVYTLKNGVEKKVDKNWKLSRSYVDIFIHYYATVVLIIPPPESVVRVCQHFCGPMLYTSIIDCDIGSRWHDAKSKVYANVDVSEYCLQMASLLSSVFSGCMDYVIRKSYNLTVGEAV